MGGVYINIFFSLNQNKNHKSIWINSYRVNNIKPSTNKFMELKINNYIFIMWKMMEYLIRIYIIKLLNKNNLRQ